MHFINLKVVHLYNCPRLENLPPFGQLPYLKNLHVTLMHSVRRIGIEFYGNAGQVFPSLEVLELLELNNCDTWSDPVTEPICPRLRRLVLQCRNLGRMPVLLSIPMEEFEIWKCGDISNSLSDSLLCWTSLLKLQIRDYLGRTSVCLSNLTMLQDLFLVNCPELTLIGGFQSLVNMKYLLVRGCPKFIEPSRSPHPEQSYVEEDLQSLTDASIDDYVLNHVWFTLGRTPSLSRLEFYNFNDLPFTAEQEQWIQQLGSLQILDFSHCPGLQRFPACLRLVSSIKKLLIRHCKSIQSLPENGLPELLEELHIWDCPILIDRCKKDGGPDWPMISNIPYIILDNEIIQKL